MRLRHSDPRVLDCEANRHRRGGGRLLRSGDNHRGERNGTLVGVLRRIREQIQKHLLQLNGRTHQLDRAAG
eukprot:4598840-Prymnesium_polylepis.1